MNRVLEVNDKTHYAVVEPGVSYFDLYRYIQEHKLNVWIDPADPGWGSPVGNSLERGGGRTPMRDHWNAVCGMEVVLPSGEVLRTGMGGLAEHAGVAPVQIRLRTGRRRPVLAVELRHRDAHGHLAHAGAGGVSRRARERAEARRPGAVHGALRVPHELGRPARHDAAREPAVELSRVAGRLVLRDAGRPFDCRARPNGGRAQPAVLERGVPLLGAAESRRCAMGNGQGEVRRDSRRHVQGRPQLSFPDRSRSERSDAARSRSARRASACSACCRAAGTSASRPSSR